MSSPAAAVSLTLLLLLAACGGTVGGRSAGSPTGPPASGSTQQLAAGLGADSAPVLAVGGEAALVLAISEEGELQPFVAAGGGEFVAGTPLRTGDRFLQLGGAVRLRDGDWFALGSGGSERVDGDEEMTFAPVGFRSGDGRSWQQVAVSGFDSPVEVTDLAVVDGRIVASGVARTAPEAEEGGFEARVWTSADGVSFARVELPGAELAGGGARESVAGSLAVSGERVLAGGRVDRAAAVWSSDDGGSTWRRVEDQVLSRAYAVSGLAAVGDLVVAGVGEGATGALRSGDGGESWQPVGDLATEGEEVGGAPVWSDGSRFWTLTGVDDTTWNQPEVCYADLDRCGDGPGPQMVASEDGIDWRPVDVPADPDAVAGTTEAGTRVLTVGAGGPAVTSYDAGTVFPRAAGAESPPTVELVTPSEGEPAQVGVRYHAPMYVHCGMDWLWFAGETWRRTDDGPDVETGAGDGIPESWPLVGQMLYGFATLTDRNRLDYTDEEGRLIATYRRASGALGCD